MPSADRQIVIKLKFMRERLRDKERLVHILTAIDNLLDGNKLIRWILRRSRHKTNRPRLNPYILIVLTDLKDPIDLIKNIQIYNHL